MLAAGTSGLGSSGGGLGYGGVANSVAVEFDTYNNNVANNDNHVSIDTNGNLIDLAAASPYGVIGCGAGISGCMANGDLWSVTIGYNGTDLSVAVQDGTHPVDNIISAYPIDIASYLGTNNAYVGFTGSTGASYENQDITTWSFANTTQLAASLVDEPSGLAVFGVALLALGVIRPRRQRG